MCYDLVIIGGGPAGYHAALTACKAGLSVLIIEKSLLGGVCLNEGCIPTKTYLFESKINKNEHFDTLKKKDSNVKFLRESIEKKLKSSGVEIVYGIGQVQEKNKREFEIEVNGQHIMGKNLLIATGSIPYIPKINGIEQGILRSYVLTSKQALSLETLPQSFVIVGGGVIALELGEYFHKRGCSVTIIEKENQLLKDFDIDISEFIFKSFNKKGIQILLNCSVMQVVGNLTIYEYNGHHYVIEAEKMLLCIGRIPNYSDIGLHYLTPGRTVEEIPDLIKNHLQYAGLYFAGDVIGKSMLAHSAYREAEVCINEILGKDDLIDYNLIPSVIYTDPEVSCVGMTEAEAKKHFQSVKTKQIPLYLSGRYYIENGLKEGQCKVVYDDESKLILGMHFICNTSSEFIFGAEIIILQKLTLYDLKKVVFPHPTVSEILHELVLMDY